MPEINNALMALSSTPSMLYPLCRCWNGKEAGEGTPLEHLSDMEMILGLGGGKLSKLGLLSGLFPTGNVVFFSPRIFFFLGWFYSGIN